MSARDRTLALFLFIFASALVGSTIVPVKAENWVLLARYSSETTRPIFTPYQAGFRIKYNFTADPDYTSLSFSFTLLREDPQNPSDNLNFWIDAATYHWSDGMSNTGTYIMTPLQHLGSRHTLDVESSHVLSWSLIVEQDLDSIFEFSTTYMLMISLLATALALICAKRRHIHTAGRAGETEVMNTRMLGEWTIG